jgi:hypothetical protein
MVRPAEPAAGNNPGWERGSALAQIRGQSTRFTSTFSIGVSAAEIPIGF